MFFWLEGKSLQQENQQNMEAKYQKNQDYRERYFEDSKCLHKVFAFKQSYKSNITILFNIKKYLKNSEKVYHMLLRKNVIHFLFFLPIIRQA